jgi:tRNA threonylcarbamoyladenosine biosynthesis protein TsaE
MPAAMPDTRLAIFLPSADSTAQLAEICAQHLGAGDTVLLSGPVGAGKSHFARALIRAHFGMDQEVPSPSFTLVQCYTNPQIEIWHADLYRLSHSGEIAELGLDDAMGTALCLIEWPDRLGPFAPKSALEITLAPQDEGRSAQISGANAPLLAALTSAFPPLLEQ